MGETGKDKVGGRAEGLVRESRDSEGESDIIPCKPRGYCSESRRTGAFLDPLVLI